ncbi:MAG: glycosyl hydrolase [Tepidisphaeraceae bacterium]
MPCLKSARALRRACVAVVQAVAGRSVVGKPSARLTRPFVGPEHLEQRRLLATLALNNQSQSYTTLPDTTVTMTGRSELHITSGTTPVTGSVFNLNSTDAWLFFENIKPSVVNSTYRTQILVNGATAVSGTNVRIVEYGMGAVVIPHTPTFQPLTTYTGPNFTGTARSFSQYTIFNTSGELVEQFDNISSFKLRRGYMATVATKTTGSGSSKVYIAADNDLDISLLPTAYDNNIEFIRVVPWRWVSKKGASDLGPTTLNAQWFYNWNNNQSSSLDAEYVPIRQQLYWPGLPGETQKDVTAVLGFNEPNNPVEDSYTSLGNGSVTAALDYWPNLEGTGLRIGAPAVTDGGKSWLYSFMDGAIARGLRVDFIPIHMYMAGQTASSLYNWLKDIYDRYHLPVWVTEFNNGANWTTAADPTYAENATAINSFIQMMDDTPWIERYAVYSSVEWMRQMTYDTGGLTPAGQAYYDNSSPISYVQEEIPNNNTGSRNIVRLPMDGNLLDASGYGNNGEGLGGIAYTAGQRGQAVTLDGATSFIKLPSSMANSNAFTFAAWVLWDGGAANQRVFDFGDDTTKSIWLAPTHSATGNMRFGIRNGSAASQFIEAPTALPSGSWQHVAVTMQGTTAKLYLNGVQQATGTLTTSAVSLTANNFLGKSQWSSDPLFKGKFDDVVIGDFVLTGTQIAALMTNNAPTFSSSTLTRGPALRGVAFSASVSGSASDADVGDSVTYGKAHGPAWLTIAADGTITGTPTFADTGAQEFVLTATDVNGAVSYATLVVEIGETYWRGDVNNNWNTNNAGNTNWASNSAGTTDIGSLPTESSDIVFAATGASNLPGTVLGANTSVRSIRVATTTGVTIGGTNNLTIGANGLVTEAGAGATTINTLGQVILGADQIWTHNATTALTVSSVIAGIGALTKAGTGTFYLTGDNLFTGTTTIAAGILQLGAGGATGSLVSDIINNGQLIVDRSTDTTLAGVILGSGSLAKYGAGRLILAGVNSFSGGATIGANAGAGVVRATGNNALGTGAVTLGPGGNASTARLELANNVTIPNAISLAFRNNTTPAVQNISGNNRLSGTISLQVGGSTVIFQSDAGLLTLGAITSAASGSRIPTLTGSGNGLVNGVISDGSGVVGIIKSGAGTWTLSAVNSYTGTTTVTAGTLALGAADRIANASGLVLSGGTLATNGYSETLGTVALSANSAINFGSGTSTLSFSGPGTFTAGTTLNITNWTSGADHLFIGTTASLTAAQLAQIRFNGTTATQLSTGEVVPVSSATPTISVAAVANPNPVTGTSAALSVLGADDGGEANLTYTWSVLSKPTGASDPMFSLNGTNAAKSSVVTFSKAGTYTLLVSALDGSGLGVNSSVSVNVNQTFVGIAAASGSIAAGTSIAVTGADQFGGAMSLGGTATWSSSVGSITQSGIFTAPVSGATSSVITATVGANTYTTTVSIVSGRAWYKADDVGASLIDSSGSNNHATLNGSYGYVGGKVGNALALTGGAASMPEGIVSGLSDFTFSAWVYLTANSSWARIFDFGTGTTSNMFLTANAGGNNALRFAITTSGIGGEQKIDGNSLPLNTWSHVAVTLVGDVGTMYVNGVAVGTNTNMTLRPASLGDTTGNYFGDSQYTADPALAGRLDDIRLLGAGLNAAGIAALRDAWQAPTIAIGGAVASPSPVVNGTTADLSVLGVSAAGEAGLTYTWSVLGTPPAPVTFSANGINAAKNTTATFTAGGTYDFVVTVTNALGASVTSTVSVDVTLPVPLASVTASSEAYGIATHTLSFTFDRDVGPLDWSTLVDVKTSDGTVTVTPSGFNYDAPSKTLTVSLPAGMADGSYVATLLKGTWLTNDYTLSLVMLGGDADRNGTVNFADLLVLASNYGGLDKTLAEGDFTGDGIVNFNDLLVLAGNYNKTLSVFSSQAISSPSQASRESTNDASVAADVLG